MSSVWMPVDAPWVSPQIVEVERHMHGGLRAVDQHRNAARMGRVQERLEVGHRPIVWIDRPVVHRVVAVVAWAVIDGHEPDPGDSEIVGGHGVAVVEVVELLRQPLEVADPVSVTVVEAAHEDLVEDAVVPP